MLCPSLGISGQLPAPIINDGEDSCENGQSIYRKKLLLEQIINKKVFTGLPVK